MSNITKKIYWVVAILLAVAQAVVSAMCIVSLIRMNILETWMVCLIIGGLVALLILCAVPLFVRKKKLMALRVICALVSILCIGGGIFAFRYTNALNNLFDKVTVSEPSEPEVIDDSLTKEPFILYISGSDSRTSVDDPGARSDVNILAVVNPVEGKILLVSIPRDTYVQLHGTTGLKDKLTHAGVNNNIERSKATIEDFLGIEIDHVAKVSFETVVKVVDELDGIEIYSDKEMNLSAGETAEGKMCSYIEGKQQVDGDCALRFARERKSYSRGDKHRGENQQEVITGIINKLVSSNNYLLRLPAILDIAADSFETTFTRDNITGFMKYQLANNVKWQIESIGLDGVGDMLPTYSYGEGKPLWVMIPDEDSLANIKDKIKQYLATE